MMDIDDEDHKVVKLHRGGAPGSHSHADTPGPKKISSTIDPVILGRLRQLAQMHQISESSITEIALSMFFARGDDNTLAIVLRELGANYRR
jgi:hypothetical protein